MELIEIGADAFQDIVEWSPVGQVGRSAQQQVVVNSNQLVSDGNGNLLQLINPMSTPHMGLVVNYLVDQNGSHIPIYETVPFGTSNDNYFTVVTEPELTWEPEVPSHLLDHMYARKRKEPGSESTPRKRKRVRKKPPAIQIAKEVVTPSVAQTTTTKVNIIRKGFTAGVSHPSSSPTTFRPILSPRPKILQNAKANVTTTGFAPIFAKPPVVKGPLQKKPIPPRSHSRIPNSSTTSVFMISNRSGPEEVLKEDCLRQVNSTTEGELCFMLTSSSSTSDDPSKTDNNETVMMSGAGQELQETDSLLNEFSICSFASDDSQLARGSSSTFLLDDKQEVYLSYD